MISRKFLEGDLCSGPENLGSKAVLGVETALSLVSLPNMMRTDWQGRVPVGEGPQGPPWECSEEDD